MGSDGADWRALAVSWPPSGFVEHNAACCRLARRWLIAQDVARTGQCEEPPSWITEHWLWGSQAWPLALCQAVESERLDCGGLAALAKLVWSARCRHVVGVQAVVRYATEDGAHWEAAWSRQGSQAHWCSGPLAYHELVGLSDDDGELRLWDPTEGHPIAPGTGYGQPVAMRIAGERVLRFGDHLVEPGIWQPLFFETHG